MSTSGAVPNSTGRPTDDACVADARKAAAAEASTPESGSLTGAVDVLSFRDFDPALDRKMHLVNNALDEIGWTGYQTRLFFLNGFGYAVDSMVIIFQSIIAQKAFWEFGSRGYANGLTVAAYVGMLAGALFWGLSADMIGRRYAFNVSLFLCSAATMIAGAMPNWPSLGFWIAIVGFGAGGNLILDTTVFLEYLPGRHQWVLTLLACWWGVGQSASAFIAWGFMSRDGWHCRQAAGCVQADNWAWRYILFTGGAVVLLMSVLRVTVVRLVETPKYLLCQNEDEKVVANLQGIAARYGRPCSLTVEQLQACGVVKSGRGRSRLSFAETALHLRGLFTTRKLALSTVLVWLSWALMGLAYPLFYVFLPVYLERRGAAFHRTDFETWRDYAATNVAGIPGPFIAGALCNTAAIGRRGTMVIGALLTAVFFFAYTAVRTSAQDLAFGCSIAGVMTIYYGTLYAYTPEVLPSAHRATGNGVAVAMNRIMGIVSAGIGTAANTQTEAPLYVCAGLFVALAGIAAFYPFEPYGKRSS